jgi:hypothetical protein
MSCEITEWDETLNQSGANVVASFQFVDKYLRFHLKLRLGAALKSHAFRMATRPDNAPALAHSQQRIQPYQFAHAPLDGAQFFRKDCWIAGLPSIA